MDDAAGLLEPDRWQWVAEHAGAFFSILLLAVALTATLVWLVLRARYGRTIARQRRQLEAFSEQLQGATPDQAGERLASLQARLARLEPRRLTGRQKAFLKKLLSLPDSSGITEINVAHDVGCSDGKQFAAQFLHVLGACPGWRPVSVTTFGSDHRTEAGLAIVCGSHGRTAAGASLLSRALTDAGIEHEVIRTSEEQLELVVTSRV